MNKLVISALIGACTAQDISSIQVCKDKIAAEGAQQTFLDQVNKEGNYTYSETLKLKELGKALTAKDAECAAAETKALNEEIKIDLDEAKALV